jgi:hypothetical protein
MFLAARWAEDGYALKETLLVEEAVRKRGHQISFSPAWRAWARYKREAPESVAELNALDREASARRSKKSPTF